MEHKLALLPRLALDNLLLLPQEPDERRSLNLLRGRRDPRRRCPARESGKERVARSSDAGEGVGDWEPAFVLVKGDWGVWGGERGVEELRVAETESAGRVCAPGEELACGDL